MAPERGAVTARSQRRERILDAAAVVIGRSGFRRASVRQIAAQAGVADGTIYNYFRDKEDLLLGLLERLERSERRKMEFGAAPPASFPDYLEAYLRHRLDALWEGRELLRGLLPELLVNARLRERYAREVLVPSEATGERLFAGMAAAGEVGRVGGDVAVRAVSGMLLGIVVLYLLGDEHLDSRREALPAELAELLVRGLAR